MYLEWFTEQSYLHYKKARLGEASSKATWKNSISTGCFYDR